MSSINQIKEDMHRQFIDHFTLQQGYTNSLSFLIEIISKPSPLATHETYTHVTQALQDFSNKRTVLIKKILDIREKINQFKSTPESPNFEALLVIGEEVVKEEELMTKFNATLETIASTLLQQEPDHVIKDRVFSIIKSAMDQAITARQAQSKHIQGFLTNKPRILHPKS